MHRSLCFAAAFVGIWLPPQSCLFAQADNPAPQAPRPASAYSPYAAGTGTHQDYSGRPFWGDTHLHTSYSTDAGMIGNTLGPEQAYRFARGEEVTTSTGQRARLVRPLDFLVISDHAENLGLAPLIAESSPELLKSEWGRRLHDMVKAGQGHEAFRLWGGESVAKNIDVINSPTMQRTAWERQIAAAEAFNEPGQFTAFMGFEWTSLNSFRNPGNLHRVVVFRDGAERVKKVLPFSTFDSPDPEQLWRYMEAYERQTGGRVLAIPHNGNLSNGQMFAVERIDGRPIDKQYSETRARREPLYEVTQIKGNGESHPYLSPTDEFSGYGIWDKADIVGLKAKEDWMLKYEYARSALQLGLQQQQKLGVNPFKFGMVGGSDSHTSLATTRDENFFGKVSLSEPSPTRYRHFVVKSFGENKALSTYLHEALASGLTALWAGANTREALFDAMLKKETYATTGTRIIVRFFGGWSYAEQDVFRPDAVSVGYQRGVPMGGDLPEPPEAKRAPVFMASALKDPWSGNLDRIQIVKGWVDEEGNCREKIYDVAVSDDRTIDPDGRCTTPVGNTVEVETATFLNSIGAPELRAVWADPDFDATLPAVYYARVIEIPTPTWQAYDARFFGTTMPPNVPLSHQERAFTSPIWYTP